MTHSNEPQITSSLGQDDDRIQIDARHAFLSIARGLDLVGVDDVHHAHRVAYIAFECATRLQWPKAKIEKAYYASLIHDCGVSTTQEHQELLHGTASHDVQFHCIRGHEALKENCLLKDFADIVLYHHTEYSKLESVGMPQYDMDICALVHLADSVDYFRCQYVKGDNSEVVMHKNKINQDLTSKHDWFNPVQLPEMLKLVSVDGFWFAMEYESIESLSHDFSEYVPFKQDLNLAEVKDLAIFLAHIVDSKSPYTFKHSEKVAKISKKLAQSFHLSDQHCEKIYMAGLMHDVGKLRVPDDILYKDDQLSPEEYAMIKRHAVDTLLTLKQLLPDTPIANWAANHHERLDGSGYPYHLKGDDLDLESRIIALADVFQALAEKRPYKERLALDEILSMLGKMVDKNKLDKQVFEHVLQNKAAYYDISTG